jgi:cellulose synthase (UDP-forming)
MSVSTLQSWLRELLKLCGFGRGHSPLSLLFSAMFVPPPPDPMGRPWHARATGLFPHVNFRRPGFADLVRVAIQLIWLGVVKPPKRADDQRSQAQAARAWLAAIAVTASTGMRRWMRRLARLLFSLQRKALKLAASPMKDAAVPEANGSRQASRLRGVVPTAAAAVLAIVCITTPFSTYGHLVFLFLLWTIALVARRMRGQASAMVLILLSITASTRYIWWRAAYTINTDAPLDFVWGVLLLGAELYAWLVLLLGYFQTARPFKRRPVPMPEDESAWPSVDVYIPTYNEPLKVVKNTVIAAQDIDWPSGKLNVHILDDGKREEFRCFAEEMGVGYLVRPDNRHAKAGNLNHALTRTGAEFIAIFDCDHIPTRCFLRLTIGSFLRDERLALVQTPHHFFSPDPFEANLGVFRSMPNEGELFHGLVQDGNDLWNASFFCGSCAVLRRKPLEEVGGIAVETVTEDAHTALKLQRSGYRTALLNIPVAGGLATESLSAHIGQRIRWARGMAQILRVDNPFRGGGLTWAQRICYGSAMLHFFHGAPRLIFLTAPLAFLLFHIYVIQAAAVAVALYVLPHLIHAQIANSRLQGRHRRSFWAEVYETVLAWYIVRPTGVALMNPHKGKFNVTPKGGMRPDAVYDWTISRPYIVLAGLNLLGFGVGIAHIAWGPPDEVGTTVLNLCWTLYNLILLGAALAVAAEPRQTRVSHRAPLRQGAWLQLPGGSSVECRTEDLSDGGVALRVPSEMRLRRDERAIVTLECGGERHRFPARVVASAPPYVRLRWELRTRQEEVALVRCTFARPDAWSTWTQGRRRDRLLRSLAQVVATGIRGYVRLGEQLVLLARPHATPLQRGGARAWRGMRSVLPRTPAEYPEWLRDEERERSSRHRSQALHRLLRHRSEALDTLLRRRPAVSRVGTNPSQAATQ